jgi:hypothetical protein
MSHQRIDTGTGIKEEDRVIELILPRPGRNRFTGNVLQHWKMHKGQITVETNASG